MSDPEARALRPLWHLITGSVLATLAATSSPVPGCSLVHWALLGLGAGAIATALALRPRELWLLWLTAGLALGAGRGLQTHAELRAVEAAMATSSEVAARVRVRVREGWRPSRWGWNTSVRVLAAHRADDVLELPTRCRLEVRGDLDVERLPCPGTTIEALVALRGTASRPLLVASSQRLLETRSPPRGVAWLRDRLARSLLQAAGTRVDRIRACELAATLALGRTDLIPASRRDGWRRSGLAHVLAVSGLHVGLVGGTVWLLAVAVGARPTAARLAVLVTLPVYAALAGASPSAMRAALMGMIYLAARLLGRALIPLAAVLLAAQALLLVDPSLVVQPGFQLTVLITAALVRWVPPLTAKLPGPRVAAAAIAVPVVAQLAAAPVVAWHFRTVVPGALLANIAVPVLLTPTLVLSVAATLIAPLSPFVAGVLLDLLSLCREALWLSGAAGRSLNLALPAPPVVAALALASAGWLALHSGRISRWGAAAWAFLLVAGAGWWLLRPPPPPGLALLPVGEGLAAVASSPRETILVDAGRSRREALDLLSEMGVRHLAAVLASHPDEDHLGGLEAVLGSLRVDQLVLPAWMQSDALTVPLVRTARRRGTAIRPVARGSSIHLTAAAVEVVWPPAQGAPPGDNERSLVVRLVTGQGTALVTADIGPTTEKLLVETTSLSCNVLLIPHHGGRASATQALLEASHPAVALVPAGPSNPHHHPHPAVLTRLEARHIPFRYPARDGLCGARPDANGTWRPFP